jgi:hypothetical protein
MRKTAIWVAFALFCIVSWMLAGFFLLITGWSSCSVTGWCAVDRVIIVLIALLLPGQAALAAYLRQKL